MIWLSVTSSRICTRHLCAKAIGSRHQSKHMRKTMPGVIVVGLLFLLATAAFSGDTEKAAGNAPLDLAPFGYVFRTGAPAGANPPETQ